MKDLSIKTRSISSLMKEISKGVYDFEHPLQRQSGQWSKLSSSRLIDSLLRLYPVFPVLVEENEDGTYGVIDGKQRLTVIDSYVNDKFSLHKSLSPIIIDGQEYAIAGKKFLQLDEVVRDRLNMREIQLYIMRNVTEEDIREIFARINSSKGLSNTQKRTTIESNELRQIIWDLRSHPVFEKLTTPNQRKKDEDKDIIRQVIMLTEMNKDYDFGSFKNDDINHFLMMYNDKIDYAKIEGIRAALNKIDEYFPIIKVKKTTVSILIYSYYRIIREHKSIERWTEWVNNFLETYETNEEYLQYCNGGGTASAEMVKGRLNYFKKAMKEI